MEAKSTIQHVVQELLSLEGCYGSLALTQAIKQYRNRRLQTTNREKRKRVSWVLVQRLYRKQQGLCGLCGKSMPLIRKEIEVDHRDPNCHEFNAEANLHLTHRSCNRAKASKSLYAYARSKHKTLVEILR